MTEQQIEQIIAKNEELKALFAATGAASYQIAQNETGVVITWDTKLGSNPVRHTYPRKNA